MTSIVIPDRDTQQPTNESDPADHFLIFKILKLRLKHFHRVTDGNFIVVISRTYVSSCSSPS
jgi:hypothetical protein